VRGVASQYYAASHIQTILRENPELRFEAWRIMIEKVIPTVGRLSVPSRHNASGAWDQRCAARVARVYYADKEDTVLAVPSGDIVVDQNILFADVSRYYREHMAQFVRYWAVMMSDEAMASDPDCVVKRMEAFMPENAVLDEVE
jgi:hypothetical protein